MRLTLAAHSVRMNLRPGTAELGRTLDFFKVPKREKGEAHVTQCPYCINGHTKAALRMGATSKELMEAIWVAAEMRAGGAYAHSTLMLTTLTEEEEKRHSYGF